MTVATFAIAGFPPLSGFFSKDEILWQTFLRMPALWVVGIVTALLTSFYMFRLWFMTFFGDLRLGEVDIGEEAHAAHAPAQAQHGAASQSHGHDEEEHGHGGVHESPWIMLAPLVILAILAFVGGWVGIPAAMSGSNHFEHFLSPAIQAPLTGEGGEESAKLELIFAGISVATALVGFLFAWLLYYKRPELPDRLTARIHGIYTLVLHKYDVDEGYSLLFVKPLLALSTHVFWRGMDQEIIDGTVNGAASASQRIGGGLRRMQSGNIRSYAAWVAAGGAAVIAYMIYLGVRK